MQKYLFLFSQLYKTAITYRQPAQGFVVFQGFFSKFGYGHKYICRAPELAAVVEYVHFYFYM